MFERLQPQAQDSILALMQMFRDDPRRDKIDLGIGVYRDASGRTPVMQAVRTAGRQLLDSETTKTYIGLAGDPAFAEAMRRLVLGDDWPADRTAAIATPGGTGALRQAFELVRMAASQATVWLPDPTWPNHLAILHHLRVPVATYRYFDAETRGVDVGGMTADLARVRPGDVVVLHGCCHNPTGADPTLPDWADLARRLADRGALPLIDLAYQGFGEGLEADAAASRLIAATCPEVLVAASCSKSFGIYRERTGLLLALGPPARMSTLQANLDTLNRHNYSFPPDHGARLVTTILTDPDLRAGWTAELEATRRNIIALREALAAELQRLTRSDRWGFLARHRGMFCRLGATPAEVARLRTERGIYMVGDSRINIAGLNPQSVPVLARAIADLVA